MANPPFNVDKVKSESASSAGRLPFGLPSVNKDKELGNANYLWISYFYAYLNEVGRAGFVMASSATDSQGKDKDIRRQLIETGHVDVMISVGNNFFYTKSLPCSLWFFDRGKNQKLLDKVLFIDARNYYTVVDRTLNEWSEWQLKNLTAIVWLYRGEAEKYQALLEEYQTALGSASFAETLTRLQGELKDLQKQAKETVESAAGKRSVSRHSLMRRLPLKTPKLLWQKRQYGFMRNSAQENIRTSPAFVKSQTERRFWRKRAAP
jgi:type I restriction enzyme M protein